MMLIVVRLLSKRQVVKAEKFIEKEVEDEAGKIQKDVDKMLKRLIELREK